MRQHKDEFLIRCSCPEAHFVHLQFFKWVSVMFPGKHPDKDIDLDISLKIEDVSFWLRIKNSLVYIFKQRKFWHYGDISLNLLDPADRRQLQELIEWLEGVGMEAHAIATDPTRELKIVGEDE